MANCLLYRELKTIDMSELIASCKFRTYALVYWVYCNWITSSNKFFFFGDQYMNPWRRNLYPILQIYSRFEDSYYTLCLDGSSQIFKGNIISNCMYNILNSTKMDRVLLPALRDRKRDDLFRNQETRSMHSMSDRSSIGLAITDTTFSYMVCIMKVWNQSPLSNHSFFLF